MIPSLLALLLLPTMLESPLWLLMKNRKEEAKSVLKRIRGQVYDVEPEIFQIEEALRIKKGTFKDVVKTGTKPFVLLFFLMFFQTASGCGTISIYDLIIFSEFQMSGTVFCPPGPHVTDVSSEDKELGPGIQLVHQVPSHVPQYKESKKTIMKTVRRILMYRCFPW